MNAYLWCKLSAVFQETFDDEDLLVQPETTAADIEDWDSVTHIQLVVAIEHAFKIKFNTGEITGLANVGQMMDLLTTKLDVGPSPSQG